jgi:hypothetical protein
MRIPTHIPQVTDRITGDRVKVAPIHALRAVFARIGQVLMGAERVTRQAQGHGGAAHDGPRSAPAARPESGREPGAPSGAAPTRWRSLDQTGNVRLLSAEDFADDLPDPPVAVTVAEAHDPEAQGAEAHEAEAQEAELPVPNYDALSVPSLRARLRGLDTAQVRVLAEYERSHAGRTDVVAMFERRIAKLAAGE